MGNKSFVRTKTLYCQKSSKAKSCYFEQDMFLMPTVPPSQKRNRKRKANLSDMDPRQLEAYKKHQQKQQDLNDGRSKRYCRLLAETNFSTGDYYFTLTYKNEQLPEDFKASQKLLGNFFRRLKRLAKKRGKELKYIGVTELGSVNGRLHHHGIVNSDSGLTREEIEGAWKLGFCNTRVNQDTRACVGYLLKAGRTYKGARLYTASRNLVKPTVSSSDTKTSKAKLRELTAATNDCIRAYYEVKYPDYFVERIYRYIPPPEQEEQDIDEEQAKMWRDGFSYLRISLRLKPVQNKK